MTNGHGTSSKIHINSKERAAVYRLLVIFGVVLAGVIVFGAYPFIQMFRNGYGGPKLVLTLLFYMGILFVAVTQWFQKGQNILGRLPYITLTPDSLIYCLGGRARIDLPWANMTILHASEHSFQVAVPRNTGPLSYMKAEAGPVLTFDIPLGGLEREGAEIAELLMERANAAKATLHRPSTAV
jgi:hypothetical protein